VLPDRQGGLNKAADAIGGLLICNAHSADALGGPILKDMQTAVAIPARSTSDLDRDIARARWLANWLDARFSILGIRFGLEGIVGIIPFAGDTLGMLAGVFPIYVAYRHRLGKSVQIRMALNLLIEWLIGIIPVIGDAADIWYKANLRNVRLLENAAHARVHDTLGCPGVRGAGGPVFLPAVVLTQPQRSQG
jgi:hypothetical protein